MKIIKGIGFEIPSLEEDSYIPLDSLTSLSDVDIAVFCPNLFSTSYRSGYENYKGKPLYNQDSSSKIIEHAKHWKSELSHFVKNGGTLFIILNSKQDIYVHTGQRETSGTGRNQKVTDIVAPLSNYDFIPFPKIKYQSASGKGIVVTDNLFVDYFNHFQEYITFEVYIIGESINNPTFTTKNKDRVLGVCLKTEKGFIIYVPNIDFEVNELVNYDSKTDISSWNDEGIKIGKIFSNCLFEIDKALRKKETKSPSPIWASKNIFDISSSLETKKIIERNLIEIQKLTEENQGLNDVLAEQESLKDLLFETGKPLEHAVIKALKILGYHAENFDDGKMEIDQIILSPEGDRFVGECEGKDTKNIDISKFRQLLDHLNEDFERDEVNEKAFGLLFGNPQRLTDPIERTLDFTQKCKSGAEREKIGLIKTSDLFFAARYILENRDEQYAKKCRDEIRSQLGKVVVFPEAKQQKLRNQRK